MTGFRASSAIYGASEKCQRTESKLALRHPPRTREQHSFGDAQELYSLPQSLKW